MEKHPTLSEVDVARVNRDTGTFRLDEKRKITREVAKNNTGK